MEENMDKISGLGANGRQNCGSCHRKKKKRFIFGEQKWSVTKGKRTKENKLFIISVEKTV